MKKVMLTILVILFSLWLSAQEHNSMKLLERLNETSLVKVNDNVDDFTIIDSDGSEHNLYDELDAGNTVLIELFFTT